MLQLSFGHKGWETAILDVFRDAFTASEGADEGLVIRALVKDLMATTPEDDLFAYVAFESDTVQGCIFFSRLNYDEDPRRVFLLSPVAVRSDRQKAGIGQKLITFGLKDLRQRRIDFAVTYGDPAYYCKVGFQPISEEIAQPPLPLSQPHGWLGQSLSGSEVTPIAGPSRCVSAFNRPELW
ncbi:GNAT family N-acetyltransferase [Ruegeria lacuscaerulensis]|uniref:GNAT family N-acetyltransferase n=1 Tax=Ruegeria lacuscaerulensis TaxID=55218 RepID=UPI0014800A5F|nr:N-acetyltransferase [Ruegeria lacuscaerulensis]